MSIIMRYANEDLDKDNLFWKARLTKNFELETLFEVSEKFGSKKRSVQLILDNRDQELTALHESYSLLNKAVVLYYDDPAGTTKTFTGVVTELNKMGLDVEITVGEQFSLYMQQPIPDLQVAVDYYSDKGINENWNAAPIIIGNVNRLKTQWVDLVYSRYIIGSGPLASIDKVYFDDVIMYDKTRSAAENIFQTSDSAKKVGVIIWRGTGWEDDPETQTHPVTSETVTSVYPGVAYLEFYNPDAVDGYGNPSIEGSAPVNADGSACEVYVDVKGISDPDTEPADPQPERNPAKILYQLATNPVTSNDHAGFDASEKGARGFGLAIGPTDIDFGDAIAFCATNNIVIDGVIAQRKEASEWFDELAKYCMATFKEIDGVFTLILDTAATEIKAHFSDTGINAYECVIGDYSEPSYDKQINRVRLYYGYNVETDKFDKRPSGSEESPISANSQYLRNESHYLKLLKWNTDKYEYKFVQDDTTAHKIAQYNFKRNILQLKTVDITIGFDTVDLDVLDVISVTSTKHSWDRKQFRIKKIVRGDKGIKLTCLEYDSNVYTDECSGTVTIDPITYPENPRPDKSTLDDVTTRVDFANDGTANIMVKFEFTLPENNCIGVEIYYKESSEAETEFKYLTFAGTSPFEIKWTHLTNTDVSKDYNFRIVSLSPTGAKSLMSITGTDKHYYGQPGAESALTISKDVVAPPKPSISVVETIPYGVVFSISFSPDSKPIDFSHYAIYRKVGTGAETLINASVKTDLYTDVNNQAIPYNTDIQYKVVAFDTSGNSTASDLSTAVQVKWVEGDDITNSQIIAKDFRTAPNVGELNCFGDYINGVKFDRYGIKGYDTTGKTFDLDTNGDLWLKGTIYSCCGEIAGFCMNDIGLVKSYTSGSYSSNIYLKLTDSGGINYYPMLYLGYSCGIGCNFKGIGLTVGRPDCGMTTLNMYGFSMLKSDNDGVTMPFMVGGAEFGEVTIPDGDDPMPQHTKFFWLGDSENYLRWRSDCNELKLSGTISANAGDIGGIGISDNGLGSDLDTSGTIKNGIALVSNEYNSLIFGCIRTGIHVYGYTFGPSIYSTVSININDTYDGSTSAKSHIRVCTNSSSHFAFYSNGNICVNCLYQTSSRETKRNFKDIGPILSIFDDIDMVAYQRKDSDQWGFGLMAEDIQSKFPWMFDGKSVHGIDMFALKGVKELHQIVKDLTTRIQLLEKGA